MAKNKGILTVGIVTIPFLYEKIPRIIQALDAVEELSKNVDALIVINNEKLKEFYRDYDLYEAFKKPNEVLAMAVKSIAEIITVKGIINRDFNDVTSTMKDSGVALVSYGFGQGENRLDNAIGEALTSPLLNNNDIKNAKRLLLYLSIKRGTKFRVEELDQSIASFTSSFDPHIKLIWGWGFDESLSEGQEVKFTLIATGFGIEAIPKVKEWQDEKTLRDMQDTEAQKAKDEARVKDVYGDILNTKAKVGRVSPSSIVILTMEEMDNDEFINFIEKNPTFNRNPKDITNMRKPAKASAKKEEQPAAVGDTRQETLIEF
jgi:cell division protein FtsZ